ncbi:hypothetical protein V9K90_11330 [Pseudomonas sp. CCNWLW56]|uniref:hypothetical protein n=1 Tax=Pseudomonas TaxID=286 RepID=UPI00095396EB|nr:MULTISPECIES: hypothetical protein [Pseudomonas]MDT8909225.1 hypothetical protein [Pseudomonas prosekii]ROO39647.1 hypothetical protein BIV08_17240 [Pseudomonas sp. AF76]ROO40017.1 hypothetical protein BIV09_10405 [Pseudomonas sp. 7SR1]SIS25907.1 hypothetical protein SAMN05428955_4170 [Pseudomonas sp. 7SR1]
MTVHWFVNALHALRGGWRGMAGLLPRRRPDTRTLRREAATWIVALSILSVGYLVTFHFASHAVQTLISTCTSRLQIEFEGAAIVFPRETPPRVLCECLAQALVEKNGIARLALVDAFKLDPLNLEPVTQEDARLCINTLWIPDHELAKSLLNQESSR